MSNANCNTCIRRHQAAADGFCEEYSAMPQISLCNAYRADKAAPTVPNKPVQPVVQNEPTGTYLHINSFDQTESRASA